MKEFAGGPEGIVVPQGIISGQVHSLYFLTFAGLAVALAASFGSRRAAFASRSRRSEQRNLGQILRGGHIRWLLVTFAITSAIQGMLGGIFVMSYGFASPDTVFSADFTLLPLAMALLGGIHSTVGPILGGLLLGLVAEWLKLQIPYGHLVVYGIMIIIVILFMPQGLLGLVRKVSRKADRRAA